VGRRERAAGVQPPGSRFCRQSARPAWPRGDSVWRIFEMWGLPIVAAASARGGSSPWRGAGEAPGGDTIDLSPRCVEKTAKNRRVASFTASTPCAGKATVGSLSREMRGPPIMDVTQGWTSAAYFACRTSARPIRIIEIGRRFRSKGSDVTTLLGHERRIPSDTATRPVEL
jgi:hypothetical protein